LRTLIDELALFTVTVAGPADIEAAD
jgi:hypothetical protein